MQEACRYIKEACRYIKEYGRYIKELVRNGGIILDFLISKFTTYKNG